MPNQRQAARTSTANFVAAARARHQRESVRILDDPYAHALCGRFLGLTLRIRPLEWLVVHGLLRHLEPVSLCVLMRARYAEQALEAAVADGITQYVVIGAGMDSFAFRRTDLMQKLEVFEIDRPATQEVKRSRLRRAGLQVPAGLHFVPADLEQISPMDALSGSRFDPSRRAFLSLLGVSYYLSADVLASTARSVAQGAAPGSQLVLDYLLDAPSARPEHLRMRARMRSFVASRGEPMRSDYTLAGLRALLAVEGFEAIDNVAMMDLAQRFEEELGPMPFGIPSLFAFGRFESTPSGSRSSP